MNWHHKSSKVLITGKSGSGKTSYWITRMIEAKPKFLFAFDPDLELTTKCGLLVSSDAKTFMAQLRGGVVVYDPSAEFPGDTAAGLEWFCDAVYQVSKKLTGKKLVAIDEIQKYTRLRDGGIPHSLQVLLDVGRREEIDLLLVSQSPNRVNDAIRCQLTEIVSFCHTDRLPVEWLEREGFNPDEVRGLKVPGGFVQKKLN